MRTLITQDLFIDKNDKNRWNQYGRWPCHWVSLPNLGQGPVAVVYRKQFALEQDATIRVHVSADERYELFLDGERVGRGSERGDADNWFYETYDFQLAAGTHMFVARIWSLGTMAPYAQMSVRHGFLFAPEAPFTELLGTGVAAWEAKRMGGYTFVDPDKCWGTGANLTIDGAAFPWGFERGDGGGWEPIEKLRVAIGAIHSHDSPLDRILRPATLPPMVEQERQVGIVRHVAEVPSVDAQKIAVRASDHLASETGWQDLLHGRGQVTLPPQTTRRIIIDLEDYYCAYPEIITSGGTGSIIRLRWDESLFTEEVWWYWKKGNRAETENKYFCGVGDTFLPDGGQQRHFDTLWWQAGRFLELVVQTANEPITIERFALRETRYPLEMESSFTSSDERLNEITPLLLRGLQVCSHETYMDCPYLEQLQYVGDTRLEVLITYAITRDDRLPHKSLRTFDVSRHYNGMTQSRYPSRVRQFIPMYAIWWAAMVHDFALWRGSRATVEAFMPGVRAVVEGYRRFTNADGFIEGPDGWNNFDWVPSWQGGIPPDGAFGISGTLNWQFAMVLSRVAELETIVDEPELAARARRQAQELAGRLSEAFWNEDRGLFADDLAHQHFSEHSQCMALLSGLLEPSRRARIAEALVRDPNLSRATIYFSHYLFEAYREIGRIDKLIDRMGLWFELLPMGLKTPIEMPEPSRSDCHAWGSHPLYHYLATILGIRPASLGFQTVEITPQLGPLTSARGSMVHPRGEITVDIHQKDGRVRGSVSLPEGVTGVLRLGERNQALASGRTDF